jgi:ATP-binding cassette subfamily F protein 3
MFGGEASDKKVKVLSGGERSRLAMIRLLLEPVNLLILDEPTNHLDLASKDVLKKAIREFDGTAIIVSHDRDFLDGLVNKVYEFGGGRVTEHIGGIYDYLSKKKLESLQQLELSVSTTQSSDLSEKAEQNTETSNKLSYLIQKEQNRKQRKLEREIEEVEDNIENLETEISTLEAELATPEGAADTEKLQKYLETKKQLEGFMSKWEKLTLELENFIR